MRQSRSYGSVRGVQGNSHPYRDFGFVSPLSFKPRMTDHKT
jgi:hypothetical protein